MKKMNHFAWFLIVIIFIGFVSCETESGDTHVEEAPELPPFESLAMDYTKFDNKSMQMKGLGMLDLEQNTATTYNLLFAGASIAVWNVVLYTTLAVPVASFKTAFLHTPVRVSNRKFQWTYTVNGFASQYTARLTGEVLDNDVAWEMFVTKTGFGAFEEMLWFSGRSALNASNGYWELKHSAAFPEKMLRIDWIRQNDEISEISYTYVRELKNDREADLFKNSSITFGKQSGEYDLFYDIHAYSEAEGAFVDTDIEWSSSANFGRVMAPHYFSDVAWHCWANDGHDIDCE